MNPYISDAYVAQLRELHERDAWGGGAFKHAEAIRYLTKKVQARTILDYGCGPGTLKTELANIAPQLDVREYDPAVPGKDGLPEPADIVACIDVLEHIEPDRLDAVLQHLYDLTIKAAYFYIATRPAQKRLPDGRNAHLIIDNESWWYDQFRKFDWKIKPRPAEDCIGDWKVWVRKSGG